MKFRYEDLSDKVALITGASTGIGRASAEAFAQMGATVVLADVQVERGEEAAREVAEKSQSDAFFVPCDVSKLDSVETLFETIHQKTGGRLDFAFNNAGVEGTPAALHEGEVQNWDKLISVNLNGVFYCMKKELEWMSRQGSGSIVNNASVAGLRGIEAMSPYCASKFGVIGLTKAAALDYAKQGIRINAVCPGAIQTEMIDRFTAGNEEARRNLEASEPMARFGQPEEIASSVLWLCSEQAGFVTGQAWAVDGGWTAR